MTATIPENEPLIDSNSKSSEPIKPSAPLVYSKSLKYGYTLMVCVLLMALETALWRKYIAPMCGSYCKLK